MLGCVQKSVCFAVFALAVSLFYSRTVESTETNRTQNLNISRNFTHNKVDRPCSDEDETLCINGLCLYPESINKSFCMCHPGFLGTRCEHMDLIADVKRFSTVEEVLEMMCVVILLLVCVCVFGCCCYRKCGSKPAPVHTDQKISV